MRKVNYKFSNWKEIWKDINFIYKIGNRHDEANDRMAIIVDREISEKTVKVTVNQNNAKTLSSLIEKDIAESIHHLKQIYRPIEGVGYGSGKSTCIVIGEEIAKKVSDSYNKKLIVVKLLMTDFSNYNKGDVLNYEIYRKVIESYINEFFNCDNTTRQNIINNLKKNEDSISFSLANNVNYKKIIASGSGINQIKLGFVGLLNYLQNHPADRNGFLNSLLQSFSLSNYFNLWLIDEYEKFWSDQKNEFGEMGVNRAISVLESLGRHWQKLGDVSLLVMLTVTYEIHNLIKMTNRADPYFRTIFSQIITLLEFTIEEYRVLEKRLIDLFNLLPCFNSKNPFEPIGFNNVYSEIDKQKKLKTPSEFITRYISKALDKYKIDERVLEDATYRYQAHAMQEFKQKLINNYSNLSGGIWSNFRGNTQGDEIQFAGWKIDLYAEYRKAGMKDNLAFGEVTTSNIKNLNRSYVKNLDMKYSDLANSNFLNKERDLILFFAPDFSELFSQQMNNIGFECFKLKIPEDIKKQLIIKKRKQKIQPIPTITTIKIKKKTKKSKKVSSQKKISGYKQLKIKTDKETEIWKKFIKNFIKPYQEIDSNTIKSINIPLSHIVEFIRNNEKTIIGKDKISINREAKEAIQAIITIMGIEIGKYLKNFSNNGKITKKNLENFLSKWKINLYPEYFIGNLTVSKRLLSFSNKNSSKDSKILFQVLLGNILFHIALKLKNSVQNNNRKTILLRDIEQIYKI